MNNSVLSARIELLTKDNFDSWKLQIEALLVMNDTWEYVSGERVKPEIVGEDAAARAASEAETKAWDVADRKARSALILAISPPELQQIKGCATSHEIWTKLQSIFQSKGPARRATLLKQLMLHKMDENGDVREHIRKFSETVDKLDEMGIKINEDLLACMLLYSLPSSYENFRCAIETRDELPNPETLKIKIIEENDARRSKVRFDGSQNAMFAKSTGNAGKSNWKKGKQQRSEKAVNSSEKKHFPYKCHRCHKVGHKAVDCIVVLNRETKEKTSVAEETCWLITPQQENALSVEQKNRWCLDSGCTSHMSCNENLFVDRNNCATGKLSLASNASTVVTGKGTVKLSVSDGKSEKTIKLQDTLFVPDLRMDLMSVGKITDRGFDVVFRKNNAVVLDKDKEVKMIADRVNGLYFVRETEEVTSVLSEDKVSPKIELWHRRMCHLNESSLKSVVRENKALGIKFNTKEELPVCEPCLKGKFCQTPFPKGQMSRSKELLEIVHTDLCGPLKTQSLGGAKYFMTFIDDFSRWCHVSFLKNKSDALDAFKAFKSCAENQLNKRIKIVQSDNGTEYVSNEFEKFLVDNGIKRRLTVPYTPQQNGVSERKNRTLVETARCMMAESNLPSSFWGETISTANYVRNRSPSRSLDGKSPFEIWTGKIPDLSHLRIFGCKVYILDKSQGKTKMDYPGKQGVFVGYSETTKGYRIWIPEKRKIEVSRDVRFINEFLPNDEHKSSKSPLESTTNTSENVNGQKWIEFEYLSTNPIREEVPVEIPVQVPEDFHEDDSEVDDFDYLSADEEPFLGFEQVPEQNPERKMSGRPRIERTGNRGRPRKVYRVTRERRRPEDLPDYANVAEVAVQDALSGAEAREWKLSIMDEFKSLIKMRTWDITDRPENGNIIGSRIVLTNKYGENGILLKRKARLVAKGYGQRPGVDFKETFAPVARISSIRLLMALAVEHDLVVHQLDVTTAFLNGDLEENIFMEIPELFPELLEEIFLKGKSTNPSDDEKEALRMLNEIKKGKKVCLLKKAMYGLKQAGRQWHKKLHRVLQSLGFKSTSADPCVYRSTRGKDCMIVVTYVDDMLLASSCLKWLAELKLMLNKHFDVKDLGKVKQCLGMEFSQKDNVIEISQKNFIEEILRKYEMQESKPVTTPINLGEKLSKSEDCSREVLSDYPFRELIGALLYLSVCTRPDICFTVNWLSQFNNCYEKCHWIALKRVLRYLRGTSDLGLKFQKTKSPLRGYVDADWANCVVDRKSYTGFVFILGNAAITWEARKQRTVALSSTEAEYMGLSEASKEAMYLKRFLSELKLQEPKDIKILNDNQGAQKLAHSNVFHNRTKHIDVRHHFVREAIESGVIVLEYLQSSEMIADVLTKGLSTSNHRRCVAEFGLQKVIVNL